MRIDDGDDLMRIYDNKHLNYVEHLYIVINQNK